MGSLFGLPDAAGKMKKTSSGLPVIKKDSENIEKIVDFVVPHENRKDPSGGWDEIRQAWFPYPSLEGGEDTVGYGTKLYSTGFAPEEVADIYRAGLSDEEARLRVRDKAAGDRKRLEKYTGKSLDAFLTPNQQVAIGSYVYNVGFNPEWKFAKNLKKAADTPDPLERQVYLNMAQSEMNIITSKGKVMPGLVKRRQSEQEKFFSEAEAIQAQQIAERGTEETRPPSSAGEH
jgi:GH24 family phage-related lysozyme (muramidase)